MIGLANTAFSLFCGFMIKYEDFPNFWSFMYWLDPLHYTIEGICDDDEDDDDDDDSDDDNINKTLYLC